MLDAGYRIEPQMTEDGASVLRWFGGRLPVQTVERLHRLLGGDAHVEGMVLRFIEAQYGAKNLFYLPPRIAREVVNRPADFLRAAKNYCEPELPF